MDLSSKRSEISPPPSLGTMLDSLPSHGSSYFPLLITNYFLFNHAVVFKFAKYVTTFASFPRLRGDLTQGKAQTDRLSAYHHLFQSFVTFFSGDHPSKNFS